MRHILVITVLGLFASVGADAHDRDRRGRGHNDHDHHRQCARSLNNRTAEQVLESHRAALNAGDFDAVSCNYAEDAVVIADGNVTHGRDNIVADLEMIAGLFGGVFPIVNQQTVVSILRDRAEMAQVLFSIETQCVAIEDGADTYIIKDGKIQAQTSHGFPTFTCPPPGP